MALQIATAGAGILRDSHYVRNPVTGLFERTTLVEGKRTNSLLQSRSLGTTPWSGLTTLAQDAIGIGGAANTAWTLTDSSTSHASRDQAVGVADDGATHTVSVFIKKDADTTRFPMVEGILTGGTTRVYLHAQINTQTGAGANVGSAGTGSFRVLDWGAYWRVEVTLTNNTTGNTSLSIKLHPSSGTVLGTVSAAATGSAVFDQAQVELSSTTASSPIFTTTTTGTRVADNISLPFPHVPQEMTVYARFFEMGTAYTTAGLRILEIGSGTRRFWLRYAGGYQASHFDGTSALSSNVGAQPSVGALVELSATLFGDGSVQLTRSDLGAEAVVGVRSGALALAGAWETPELWIGSAAGGATTGFTALTHIRIERGVKTLAEMRATSGVS